MNASSVLQPATRSATLSGKPKVKMVMRPPSATPGQSRLPHSTRQASEIPVGAHTSEPSPLT